MALHTDRRVHVNVILVRFYCCRFYIYMFFFYSRVHFIECVHMAIFGCCCYVSHIVVFFVCVSLLSLSFQCNAVCTKYCVLFDLFKYKPSRPCATVTFSSGNTKSGSKLEAAAAVFCPIHANYMRFFYVKVPFRNSYVQNR